MERPPSGPAPYGTDHGDLDGKIVAALERVAQSLRVLLWHEAREHDLTPLQLQVLVYLLGHDGEQAWASHLAREFGVTRATISESIAALLEKGMLERSQGRGRRGRALFLQLTPLGVQVASKAARWGEAVQRSLADLSREERTAVLLFLMRLIAALQRAGIVTVARMCITCRFFRPDHDPAGPQPHYCDLLRQPLAPEALRVDCPEHSPLAPS